MIYLASPYSHEDPKVRKYRFIAARDQTVEMMKCGLVVFSPIAYSHQFTSYGIKIEWEHWEEFDKAILKICSELWVLTLDGWRASVGVQEEIKIAEAFKKPIRYVGGLE